MDLIVEDLGILNFLIIISIKLICNNVLILRILTAKMILFSI